MDTKIPPDTRVTKRLGPDQPGARKLARRHGDALVCVRYRLDTRSGLRFTTIELVVDAAPVRPRATPAPPQTVTLPLGWGDNDLRARALAEGAQWDIRARVWRLPRELAERLGAVPPGPPPRPHHHLEQDIDG